MAQIGIRLADGRFYPILDEGAEIKKRLVLTTVKDGQTSVQIDVYRGAEDPLVERSYVGSLVIENIPARPKGEPDIRLDIGLDAEGNLSAYAKELVSGEHQALSVSLKSLSHDETYDIPDFDFQEDGASLDDDFDIPEEGEFASAADNPFDAEPEPEGKAPALTFIDDGYAQKADEAEEQAAERRGSRVVPWLIALAIIVAALAVAFVVFQCTADRQPPPPVASAPASQPAPAPQPAPATPAPAPATQAATPPAPAPAPAATPAPAPAPAATPAPAPAQPAAQPPKQGGVNHKIRWGDTLWDISIAYYRTPWLYGTIARANNIKNPDLIISGTTIYIPPR